MTKLHELLNQYKKLCDHCDGFFAAVAKEFGDYMQCAKGCSSCCTIESVSQLEAHAIEEHIRKASVELDSPTKDGCVFLHEGACAIYPVRPVICRTHGLILYDSEEDAFDLTCSLNFNGGEVEGLDSRYALDSRKITENLVRLNLAFLMITGSESKDMERVGLSDLAERLGLLS